MRLPWPFGRRTPSDGQPSHMPEDARGGASPVEAASDPARDAAARLAPATGAWSTLPPIQRTVSAPPLVAPAAPFLADVSGHRPLPPIVQPLGHETGASAPPGLVVAHVSTVPSLTSRAPMPTRPVQRTASGTASSREGAADWSTGPDEPARAEALRATAASAVSADARDARDLLGRRRRGHRRACPDPASRHGGPRGNRHARRQTPDQGARARRRHPAFEGPRGHPGRRFVRRAGVLPRRRQPHDAAAARDRTGPLREPLGRVLDVHARDATCRARRAALRRPGGPAPRRHGRGRTLVIGRRRPHGAEPRHPAPADGRVAPRGPGCADHHHARLRHRAAAAGQRPAAAAGGARGPGSGGPARTLLRERARCLVLVVVLVLVLVLSSSSSTAPRRRLDPCPSSGSRAAGPTSR